MKNLLQLREQMKTAALALAATLLLVAATHLAQAQTYSVLYTFTGPDGASPTAGLALDAQGNLYGTTFYGGDTSCYAPQGCGTVFKLDPSGKETVLHSFTQAPDGAYPDATPVLDAQGNLYGTTLVGGVPSCADPEGCGTVFEVDHNGVETALWSFPTAHSGMSPRAELVLDAQGNLYGTTESGGGHLKGCERVSCGAVFKVSKKGKTFKEDRLYSFKGKADSGWPEAGLVLDAQGNLYGTTAYGTGSGSGTAFKVSLIGGTWQETVIHAFTGGAGTGPFAGLVLDTQGNLYGTTFGGGAYSYGTVFKLDTAGNETVLYSFAGPATGDGQGPEAGLVLDAQRNLYGTTVWGGDAACDAPHGCGTVFKVDTNGQETVLHSFTGTDGDGAFPYAALVRDSQGNLYGTTFNGGLAGCSNGYSGVGCGVVFKVTP